MALAEIRTSRLTLIPSTPALLQLELSDLAGFEAALDAALPDDWPPGEYDREAIAFFLEKLTESGPSAIGWYGWYVIQRGAEGERPHLVGGGGYLGPPDKSGAVEVGYSISEHWRGRGIATELVTALVDNALDKGASRIIAHARRNNPASIEVLTRCGFQQAVQTDPWLLEFEYVAVTPVRPSKL
jgi:[ribosomal protein S5]-alanine N-acetyltransferase